MESATHWWVKRENTRTHTKEQHTHDDQMSRLLHHTNRAEAEGRFKTNRCMAKQWKHTCTYEHTHTTVACGNKHSMHELSFKEEGARKGCVNLYDQKYIKGCCCDWQPINGSSFPHKQIYKQQHVHSIWGCNLHFSVVLLWLNVSFVTNCKKSCYLCAYNSIGDVHCHSTYIIFFIHWSVILQKSE